MTDNPLTHLTVAARVAEQLLDEIHQGRLAAGTRLRQNDVAARLGVSSTPVREAFQILERRGLVVREDRRGVRVFNPSARDLIDAYEVRSALEALACRLAASRVTASTLATLTSTVDQMHVAGVSQENYLRLNAEFHAQIAAASGNEHLAELVVAEQTVTSSFVMFLGVDPTSADEAHEEHAVILSAIAMGDGDAAAEAMSTHLMARVDGLRARLGVNTVWSSRTRT